MLKKHFTVYSNLTFVFIYIILNTGIAQFYALNSAARFRERKDMFFMKKFTKILSVFMALLMVATCIPMTAFAQGRDTSSLDAYIDKAYSI